MTVGSVLKDSLRLQTSATVAAASATKAFNTAKSFTGIVDQSNKSLRIMKGVGAMAENFNKKAIGPTLPTSVIKGSIQPGNL